MSLELGVRVKGTTEYIPRKMLKTSVKGSIYEMDIKTTGIPLDKRKDVADLLVYEMWDKFHARTHWVEVTDKVIKIQITGSPFVWAALLLFIPEILTGLGITVTLIAVLLLIGHAPVWVLVLGVIGVGLIIFGKFAPRIKPPALPVAVGQTFDTPKEAETAISKMARRFEYYAKVVSGGKYQITKR